MSDQDVDEVYADGDPYELAKATGRVVVNADRMPDDEEVLQAVVHSFVNFYGSAVSKCAHDHGWWEAGERNMGEMIALMHSELSEALEEARDPNNTNIPLYYTYGKDQRWEGPQEIAAAAVTVGDVGDDETVLGKPCGLASEFADTIIRILDTCVTLNIPIGRALLEKHRYNLTRPYRHGGKLA